MVDAIIPRIESINILQVHWSWWSMNTCIEVLVVTFAGNKSSEAGMESIAMAMRHCRRYQKIIYD